MCFSPEARPSPNRVQSTELKSHIKMLTGGVPIGTRCGLHFRSRFLLLRQSARRDYVGASLDAETILSSRNAGVEGTSILAATQSGESRA